MSNNCIKLPIKSLDFDKFVKMFTDEMKITFDNFHKSKNHNKNVKILEESLRKNIKNDFKRKRYFR